MNSVLKELYNLVKYFSWNKISSYSQKIHLYKYSTQYVFLCCSLFHANFVINTQNALILLWYSVRLILLMCFWRGYDGGGHFWTLYLQYRLRTYSMWRHKKMFKFQDIRKCSNFKAKTFGFFFTKNYSVAKNIIII